MWGCGIRGEQQQQYQQQQHQRQLPKSYRQLWPLVSLPPPLPQPSPLLPAPTTTTTTINYTSTPAEQLLADSATQLVVRQQQLRQQVTAPQLCRQSTSESVAADINRLKRQASQGSRQAATQAVAG